MIRRVLINYAFGTGIHFQFDVGLDMFEYDPVLVIELSQLSQFTEILSVDFIQVLELDHLFLTGILIFELVLEIEVFKLNLYDLQTNLFLINHVLKIETYAIFILHLYFFLYFYFFRMNLILLAVLFPLP